MLCTQCVTEIPDGSLSCPKCGRRFGATPVTPEATSPTATAATRNSPAPTPLNDPRLVEYVQQHQRIFKQRRARSDVIGFVIMFLVAGATFLFFSLTLWQSLEGIFDRVTGKIGPGLFVLLCFFIGLMVKYAFDAWMLRKAPIPTLPCPYPAAPLPLFVAAGTFQPLKWTEACPRCGHGLPFPRPVDRASPAK